VKGLVSRIVPPAAFEAELQAAVDRICRGAPLSARAHKRFVARLRDPRPLAPEEVAEGFACYDTEDYRIGRTTFLARQEPVFTGR
jgi:enoyl-CoA hydratase